MDTRDTPEQAELRRAASQLALERSATSVVDLDDRGRAMRLASAVRDAGWLELRHDAGAGTPLGSGVETAIVAEALGANVADVAFAGPILAADLARRTGIAESAATPAAVAFDADLASVVIADSRAATDARYAVDAEPAEVAYVLVPDRDGYRLGCVPAGPGDVTHDLSGTDLTRTVREIRPDAPTGELAGQTRLLTADDLAAWTALGLALTSADLVGVMRGVLDLTVAYAAERRQYGVRIGSFQAVAHMLADARCLLEGSLSVAQHASWAVDALAPSEALDTGRVAKAYCARAARTVCETAIQVHGGIGNTWECMVHVYLRRALLSTQWFGDDGTQLLALSHTRLGAGER